MNQDWIAYAVVAVLSIGAGVAIAGVPTSGGADPTIVPPSTTEATGLEAVATTVPLETTTLPTETTTLPPETTTNATETTTTTTVPEPTLPDRSEEVVVVANAASIGGLASSTVARLEELGYVDVRATDGSDIVDTTVVYFADGFEASAARLAVDLGVEPTAIEPIILAPDIVGGLDGESLLAYLGVDQELIAG